MNYENFALAVPKIHIMCRQRRGQGQYTVNGLLLLTKGKCLLASENNYSLAMQPDCSFSFVIAGVGKN